MAQFDTPMAPYTTAPSYPSEPTAATTPDFLLDVTRVLQGVDASVAAAVATNHTSIAPSPASLPGMLDASAYASGPASRRRGIEYAKRVKDNAREEFKEKRRRELEASGEGERIKRRKKNDTSMSEDQKYRRRLQKNQDSAAAARHASESYLTELERQVKAYDEDMTRMEDKVRGVEFERDEYARINTVLMERNRKLEAEMAQLREALAVAQTTKPVAIDEMASWRNSDSTAATNVPPTPPAVKNIFDEYPAPNYNFSLEGKLVHVRTPAAF